MSDEPQRVALVTGGASGMGRATARRLARDGFAVALADLDAPGAEAVAAELGDRALVIRTDVREVAACEAAVRAAVNWGGQLDVLVNAAGVWAEGDPAEVDEATFDWVVDVNLKGTFFMCRFALPELERTEGCIVNVSSDAGLHGSSDAAVYAASKGGVTLLTKSLALQLAPRGVRVNAVCPGDVDTAMLRYQADTYGGGDPEGYLRRLLAFYPQGDRVRFIRPEEVADLIAYLASPSAAPITGAAVSIDFGLTAGY